MSNLTEYQELEIASKIDNYIDPMVDWLLYYMNDLKWVHMDATAILTYELMEVYWREILPTVADLVYWNQLSVDYAISYIYSFLGLTYNYDLEMVEMTGGGLLGNMGNVIEGLDGIQGQLVTMLYGDLGATGDTTEYGLSLIVAPTIHELDERIKELEKTVPVYTEAQIEAMNYICDHAVDIREVIEGNITSITEDVFEKVEPVVASLVTDRLESYDTRLTIMETIVAQHEYFFFDWLMNILASLLAPAVSMAEDLEAAVEIIKGWITTEVETQIAAIKDTLTFELPPVMELPQEWIDNLKLRLEITGNGDGGLSASEVQVMINSATSPISSRIAGIQSTIAGLVIPTESQVKEWIKENPATVSIADYIGDIDVLLGKAINDKLTDPDDIVSTVASIIIADNTVRLHDVEGEVLPIIEFFTDDMKTSLTDIVDAFGTPEALVSYLVNAPEGQEDAMLELMQILITMTLERGLI
jgi:hypothetical protein